MGRPGTEAIRTQIKPSKQNYRIGTVVLNDWALKLGLNSQDLHIR